MTFPVARLDGDNVMLAHPLIARLYARLAEHPELSSAWTVKWNTLEAFGVPERVPPELKVRPPGSVPAVWLHVYDPLAPEAVNVWLYAVPVVPDVRLVPVPLGNTLIAGQDGVTVYC